MKIKTAAFTLIELLTVIAIIGILAAILIPVVGKARQSAGKATAVSAMREMGVGLLTFAAENDGFLPPGRSENGFWLSHHGLNTADRGNLPAFLAAYLGMPIARQPEEAYPLEGFVSRNHLRAYQNLRHENGGSLLVYASNRNVDFGDRRAPVFGFFANNDQRPLSLSAIEAAHEPVWLLQEADQEGGFSASWDRDGFPAEPVHGNVRHRLFADGHVEALELEASQL